MATATKLVINGGASKTSSGNSLNSLEGQQLTPELLAQIKTELLNEVTAAASASGAKPKGKKSRTKRPADPNKPKRAQTAYMLWLNQNRSAIIDEYFTTDGECTLTGRDKVTQVAKKAGELWGTMDDETKAPFETQSAEAKAKYQEAMAEYKGSNPVPVDPEDDMPAAPDGWAGPFENTYIFKLAERKTHTSFASAVSRAQELGPEVCGGITKSGSRYSLRKPGPPLTHDLPTVSWCLEDAISFVASKPSVSDDGESDDGAAPKAAPKAPKKAAPKKTAPKKAGSKKALVVQNDAEPVVEPEAENGVEPDAENGVEPEAENGVEPDAENDVEPDAENGVEPDAENDVFDADTDGEAEEGLQVEQIEVDGTEYLFNPSSGEVYDYQHYIDNEEVKVLGTYDPESDQLELS